MNDHPTLFDSVQRYLAYRQSLGYGIQEVGYMLRSFAAFASQQRPAGPVTTSAAVEWAMGSKALSPGTQKGRLSAVRTFARYCAAFDPRTEIPPKLLGVRYHRRIPYIYSMTEIVALMKAARALRPGNGLHPHTYNALIGLLASTGIRVGEATRLELADVRWEDSALLIRKSKRVKERWVPVHSSTLDALRRYARRRSVCLANPPVSRFFINNVGRPLTYHRTKRTFRLLCAAAGIMGTGKGKPRIHDLRHTFVCMRLLQWHKEGVSLDQGMLALSAYLGHAEPTNTYWYLSTIPELLDACGKRFEEQTLRRIKGGRRP